MLVYGLALLPLLGVVEVEPLQSLALLAPLHLVDRLFLPRIPFLCCPCRSRLLLGLCFLLPQASIARPRLPPGQRRVLVHWRLLWEEPPLAIPR